VRLSIKFAVFALGSGFILFAALAVSIVNIEKRHLLDEVREEAALEAAHLAAALSAAWKDGRGLRPGNPLLARLMAQPGFRYLVFEDEQGRARFTSKTEPGLAALIEGGRPDPGTRQALEAAGLLVRSRWRDAQRGAVTEILLPVEGPLGTGTLRLGLRDSEIEAALGSFARDAGRRVSIIGVWAFLAYFTLAFLFGRRLEAPYWDLHRRARALLGAFPGVGGKDVLVATEIGALEGDLDGMARTLSKVEGSRRELLGFLEREFRAHLGRIERNAEVGLSGIEGDANPVVTKCLGLIREQTLEFERLFDNVMHWVQAEYSLLELESGRVEIEPLLKAALGSFERAALQHGILLKGHVPQGIACARADYRRTYLALTNLLSNALRFTPSGGEVRVHASDLKGHVQIAVTDTGPGIPERELGRVHEKFYRVPGLEPARGTRGVGLGLSVAKALMEAQGGRILIESPDGQGTVARLLLPRAA